MTDTNAVAIDALIAALSDGTEESRASASALLADDVEVFAPFGVGTGREAGDAALADPRVNGMLQGAEWSTPRVDGDLVRVTASAAPGAFIGGMEFGVGVDAEGRINRIEEDLIMRGPPAPAPIVLTDAHTALLADALTNGTPQIVGYVDPNGVPKLSYRATVQVLDPQRLAMWIRDPNGGLVRALETNPNLSVFYGDRTKGVTLQFTGRGHVDDTDAVRDAVYEASPKAERDIDWRKRGVAVVVDLDRVEGRDASGVVSMAADPGRRSPG